jgi:hypothetical protein
MVRSTSSDELLRSARNAAATPNVREAVRDLTLHALRSRLLTAAHIARVARTVGEGIESSEVAQTAPVREINRGAWAGLEEAVGRALYAVELAAREFAEGRARLADEERDRLLAELAGMERSLAEGWSPRNAAPRAFSARIAAASELLHRSAARPGEPASATGHEVSLLASGVLVGLSNVSARPPG